MKCVKCGADIPNGSEFCTKCGFGQKGKKNRVREKDLEENFRQKAQDIYNEYDFFGNDESADTVKRFRDVFRERENKYPNEPMQSPVILVIACVLIAVFSILIPGLNFNNPDFQFIASDTNMAKGLCASIGMIPLAMYLIKGDGGISLGTIIGSIIGGVIAGFIDIGVLAFFNGFFQNNLLPFDIISASIVVIYAAYKCIKYNSEYSDRVEYSSYTRQMDILQRAAENELQNRFDKLCKEYENDLSKEKMDIIILNVKTCINNERLQKHIQE